MDNKKQKLSTTSTTIIISSIVLLIFVVIASFFIWLKIYDKVLPGIYLSDRLVSSMTKEQLTDYLTSIDVTKTIKVMYEGKEICNINSNDIELKIDTGSTISNIMNEGRNGNIFVNACTVISNIFNNAIYMPSVKYSEEKLQDVIDTVDLQISNLTIDDTYYINEQNMLVIKMGRDGVDYDRNKFKQELIEKVTSQDTESIYNIQLQERKAKRIDVDKLYEEICKEAKDAYEYVDDSGNKAYQKHQVGVSFDKQALSNAINNHIASNAADDLEFKLTVVQPNVKIGDLRSDKFADLLGTFSTTFSASNTNRATNIKVASSFLDGVIIKPGEVFSFNETVGDCGSAERGFKLATIYVYGGTALGMGGGVCQVSTTLYNAIVLASLEVVSRSNHGFTVSYVEPSRDATISYPYVDLKIKNTREFPVKISAIYSQSGRITFSVYGTKEDIEYDVEIDTEIKSTLNFGTIYQNDSGMLKGKEEIIQYGQNGYMSVAYKILKQNGVEISRTVLSNDVYSPMPQIIKRGTKEVNPYGG